MKKQDLVNLVKEKLQMTGFQPSDTLVLAVSGGPDSMALLDIFIRLKADYSCQLVVVHVNHKLRKTSARDQKLVERYCNTHNLLCITKQVDVGAHLGKNRGGIEEKARELRYKTLRQVARKMKAKFIVTAHNRDDQVETIVFNFLRGSGLRGLGGMREVSGDIIRPLISVPKKELLALVKKHKVPFVVDPSNRSMEFTRNRIRHRLLPVLREYNPAIDKLLIQNSYIFGQAELVIDNLVRHYLSLMRDPKTDKVSISISKLAELTPFMQVEVIKAAIRETLGSLERIKKVHFDEIFKLIASGKSSSSKSLPGKLFVQKAYDKITISRAL